MGFDAIDPTDVTRSIGHALGLTYAATDISQEKSSENQPPAVAGVGLVVTNWRTRDLASGIVKSKFFRAIPLSLLAVGGLFLVMACLSHGFTVPKPWMIAAAAVGGYALGVLIQLPFCKGAQKMSFETSACYRLLTNNYGHVTKNVPGTKGQKQVFLGAIPNRLRKDGENLVNVEHIGAVLSLNEPWERSSNGLSLPYTEEDWKTLGVVYEEMNIIDHTLLSNEQLDAAADFIHKMIKSGKNVYVHCRAGNGRSAMAVAAYLIKYRECSVQQAAINIKAARKSSTIWNKETRLNDYKKYLDSKETK